MKINKVFFLEEQGSITIEALGIFSIFILITTLCADIGSALVTKLKLDNLSYSLASIVRERSQLYPESKDSLTQENVDKLYDIATQFLKNSAIDTFAITIDSLSFSGDMIENQGDRTQSSFTKGNLKCQSQQDINDLANLSFYTRVKTWNTIYLVTVCANVKNNFLKIGNVVFNPIGNAVVYRR